MSCSDPDRFFADDPQAIALWRDYLADHCAIVPDGTVYGLLTKAADHPRAAYAASLARKKPDLFFRFANMRRLTR